MPWMLFIFRAIGQHSKDGQFGGPVVQELNRLPRCAAKCLFHSVAAQSTYAVRRVPRNRLRLMGRDLLWAAILPEEKEVDINSEHY